MKRKLEKITDNLETVACILELMEQVQYWNLEDAKQVIRHLDEMVRGVLDLLKEEEPEDTTGNSRKEIA